MPEAKELITTLSHTQIPHCCGCWNITYDAEDGQLKATCNECGQVEGVSIDCMYKDALRCLEQLNYCLNNAISYFVQRPL